MTIEDWVKNQEDSIQQEFFKKASHYLNNNELKSVMRDVAVGVNLLKAHKTIGAFEKYQIDFARIAAMIEQKNRSY